MIRFNVIFFAFILAVSFSSASAEAETYTWTDEQGTIHFTEDPGSVPEKIRNKALRNEEMNSAPEEAPSQVPSAKAPEATLQAAPGSDGDNVSYAGKTQEEWQKELAEREAAMEAVRKRIVEIADQRKNPAVKRSEQDKLFAEQKSLQSQFNDMKAEYFQLVESARKAGLTVNIQE